VVPRGDLAQALVRRPGMRPAAANGEAAAA